MAQQAAGAAYAGEPDPYKPPRTGDPDESDDDEDDDFDPFSGVEGGVGPGEDDPAFVRDQIRRGASAGSWSATPPVPERG